MCINEDKYPMVQSVPREYDAICPTCGVEYNSDRRRQLIFHNSNKICKDIDHNTHCKKCGRPKPTYLVDCNECAFEWRDEEYDKPLSFHVTNTGNWISIILVLLFLMIMVMSNGD